MKETFFISGLYSGPSPSAGLGVARSLRAAFPSAHLVGVDYWAGLVDWVRDQLETDGRISPGDIDILQVADTPEEACRMVVDCVRGNCDHPGHQQPGPES